MLNQPFWKLVCDECGHADRWPASAPEHEVKEAAQRSGWKSKKYGNTEAWACPLCYL